MRINALSVPRRIWLDGTGLALGAPHNKGVCLMIEFPLILIGYALVPLIAIQLMIMADRPQSAGDQNVFPHVEIL